MGTFRTVSSSHIILKHWKEWEHDKGIVPGKGFQYPNLSGYTGNNVFAVMMDRPRNSVPQSTPV